MDREQFLTWAETVLRPCALPGALPGGASPYRSVRVAPRQYLGVDALQDGVLRVYLYSNHAPHKARWLRLREGLGDTGVSSGPEPLTTEARARLFARDNGEEHRGFLGFEWRGARDLSREQAPLSQYVTWLLRVARGA